MKATRVCSVDGCERGGKITRGLCGKHYQRQWKSGDLAPIPALTRCSVEGCAYVGTIRRGMCNLHYQRVRRNGSSEPPPPHPSAAARLAAGLERKPNGCLEWTGCTHRQGYGMITINSKSVLTHRFAWQVANGPIPEGLEVCHKCDNPPCSDVDHLFLGTHADNMADKAAKGKAFCIKAFWTHCPRNHPFDEINTYVSPKGRRQCRACRRARGVALYALRRTP